MPAMIRAIAVALALAMGLRIAAQADHTYGALAVDNEREQRFGIAYSYRSRDDARSRARRECGRNCSIVSEFEECIAYAADETRGSSVFGWGENRSRRSAEDRALYECSRHGGRRCVIRGWACND